MMRYRNTYIRINPLNVILMISLIFAGCNDEWDSHFGAADPRVNQLMWDDIRNNDNYSFFEKYIVDNKLDTILKTNQQYTIFIPTDKAFENAPDSIEINSFILNHLISPNVVNLRNIPDAKKLLTLSGKFALIEHRNESYLFDGVDITYISPLFLNGRFYEVDELPLARPNFDEYFNAFIPVISDYISLQVYDSLDKKMSTPIGFDENGNTIYDSVFIVINPFENKYFPISMESREDFATFVIFSQEQYESALDEMALSLGGNFQSHEDIPLNWQESILLPAVLDNGIFENILSIDQLSDPNLLNINGDTVDLDISNVDPGSQFLCSNGVIYGFYNFNIPEELYLGENNIEGEDLVDSTGLGKYSWKESVTVKGANVAPIRSKADLASGGALVNVTLGRSFSGNYSVEFSFSNVFPGRHRLVWGANYIPSGIYTVYINDEPVGEFDTFNLRNTLKSITGELFKPNSAGFNRVDFWVENLTDFGDVRVRFEYKGSGISTNNGFNIDYVKLISAPI